MRNVCNVLDHPETNFHHQVRDKTVFHETDPWCQQCFGTPAIKDSSARAWAKPGKKLVKTWLAVSIPGQGVWLAQPWSDGFLLSRAWRGSKHGTHTSHKMRAFRSPADPLLCSPGRGHHSSSYIWTVIMQWFCTWARWLGFKAQPITSSVCLPCVYHFTSQDLRFLTYKRW